jgi:hypothetical protein
MKSFIFEPLEISEAEHLLEVKEGFAPTILETLAYLAKKHRLTSDGQYLCKGAIPFTGGHVQGYFERIL